MIINAENIILGRLASYAAKQALLGEKIIVINCEKAIISGNKEDILNEFSSKIKRGNPFKGPFYPRRSDMIVRRTIRGMLPHKQYKGEVAFKRVKCYKGIPEQFKDKKAETVKNANVDKSSMVNYISVDELCRLLRGGNYSN